MYTIHLCTHCRSLLMFAAWFLFVLQNSQQLTPIRGIQPLLRSFIPPPWTLASSYPFSASIGARILDVHCAPWRRCHFILMCCHLRLGSSLWIPLHRRKTGRNFNILRAKIQKFPELKIQSKFITQNNAHWKPFKSQLIGVLPLEFITKPIQGGKEIFVNRFLLEI